MPREKKSEKAEQGGLPPASVEVADEPNAAEKPLQASKPKDKVCPTCSNPHRAVVHKGSIDVENIILHKPFDANSKAERMFEHLITLPKLSLFLPHQGSPPAKGQKFVYHDFTYNGLGLSVPMNVHLNVASELTSHLQEGRNITAAIPYSVNLNLQAGGVNKTIPARLDMQSEEDRGMNE